MEKERLSSAEIKKVCDILRRDDWVWAKNYAIEFSRILFLKLFEEIEHVFSDIAYSKGENYNFIIEKKYQWSSWVHNEEYRANPEKMLNFIKWKLFPYLKSLSGDYGIKIAQIFNALVQPKILSWYNLIDVVDIIDKIDRKDFIDSNLLSHAYEDILWRMWKEAWWSWEYYTPRPVIKFIINIINPDLWEKIFDPFIWSAWFLVESFKFLKEKSNWNFLSIKQQKQLMENTFYWQEKLYEWYIFWMMNLISHGILKPNIDLTNTFSQDLNDIVWKYDIILTNPPFWGKEAKNIYKHYEYPTSATEWLALQYIMKSLKNGWRAWVVLPNWQILFGTWLFENIRQKLLEKNKLKYIVSFPTWIFAQMSTGIKTVCLIFEKWWNTKNIVYYQLNWKYTKKKPLLFEETKYILEDMEKVETENIFDKNLTQQNIENFRINWKKENLNFDRWIVSIEDLKNNHYDISPKDPFEEKERALSLGENIAIIKETHKQFEEEFEKLEQCLKDNDLLKN